MNRILRASWILTWVGFALTGLGSYCPLEADALYGRACAQDEECGDDAFVCRNEICVESSGDGDGDGDRPDGGTNGDGDGGAPDGGRAQPDGGSPDGGRARPDGGSPDGGIPLGCGDMVVVAPEACDEGTLNSESPDATCRTDC